MTPGTKLVFWSQAIDWRCRREVAIIARYSNGAESICKPLEFVDLPPDQLISTPTLANGTEFLQAALDHAWEIGLRPAGFADVPLQTAALKEHLNDMRALVFSERRLILPFAAPGPNDGD